MVFKLINLYALNVEMERKEIFTKLKRVCTGNCLVVGDFNVWCTRMDVWNTENLKNDASRNVLNDVIHNNLVDVWRCKNPYKRSFSRRQMVNGELKQSRIDLCLVKREILRYVNNMHYLLV